MQTCGQVEAIACEVVNKFLQQMVGRGASNVTAMLTPDVLLVHLRDVLTTVELTLANTTSEDGRSADSVVRAIRDQLVRRSRAQLARRLAEAIGRQPMAVLHDVEPTTGEEILVFTFAARLDVSMGSQASRRSPRQGSA